MVKTVNIDSIFRENYYNTNFVLIHEHNFKLDELDDMLPWEREIYMTLVRDHVQEENERIKKQNG